MTLIQAQQQYIDRVTSCHSGHVRRVSQAAWSKLHKWATVHGYDPKIVCQDAKDMAVLEQAADD